VTSWDDVRAAQELAEEYAGFAHTERDEPAGAVMATLAVRAEIRASLLALSMLLTPYPDSEATLGGGG
jgi:hypothetical protein